MPFFLLIILTFSCIAGGGYFCWTSALLSIVLLIAIIFVLMRADTYHISCDLNLAAIAVLALGYFITGLWAVDSGMSLMGGIKFLPVCLFFFLMCQALDQRERLICFLPVMGSLMTIISIVMRQIPQLRTYVVVARRLAGFFQYPNTYALFMLICLLISLFQIDMKKADWQAVIHIVIALLGIYLSGSRTVMVLAACTVLLVLILKKELRKYGILCLLVFVILMTVLAFCGYGDGIISRMLPTAKNSSTFWGRLLYAQDAVKMIVAHPFGMGYYGYYFVQQEIQTGVYSVVNVHNGLLQIMLDIGVLPALLLYGAIIRSIISNKLSVRNRVILAVTMLHSLFDFDLQFLAIYFIVLLFLELRNVKEIKTTMSAKASAGIILIITSVLSVMVGISDYFYINGKPKQATRFYDGNTMAKIDLLNQAADEEEMERLADSILESNSHVSVAYSAKARVEFSKGDVEKFIKYKLTAIRLAPYQYDEYTDYLDSLAYCTELYLQGNDMESAGFCVKMAEEVPDMLENVKKKTSSFGWKIVDRPEVTLSEDDLELIEEMRGWVR